MDMTKDDARRELERMVVAALRGQPTLAEFCQRLRDAGAGIWLYQRQGESGRPQITGGSLSLGGQVVKLSHLGQPPGQLGLGRLIQARRIRAASAGDFVGLDPFYVQEADSASAKRKRQAQGLAGAWAQEKERDEAARKLAASGRAVAHELAGLPNPLVEWIVRIVNAMLRACGLDQYQLALPTREHLAQFRTPQGRPDELEKLKAGLVVTERFRTALAANDAKLLRPLGGASEAEMLTLEAALNARKPAKLAREKALAELPNDERLLVRELQSVESELSKFQREVQPQKLRDRRALLLEKQRMVQAADFEAMQLARAERYLAGLPTPVAELEKQLWQLEKSGADQAEIDAQVDAINMARKQHSLPSLDEVRELEEQVHDVISEIERHRER